MKSNIKGDRFTSLDNLGGYDTIKLRIFEDFKKGGIIKCKKMLMYLYVKPNLPKL